MRRAIDPADLSLIVRALHRDVSELDARLRRLESEIRTLRARAGFELVPDLRMLDLRPRGWRPRPSRT